MQYLSVSQFAKKWGVSERTVHNYCATGKTKGAFLTGKKRAYRAPYYI
ncbi:helix-turn-helix domain-containing protein [Parabacteroides sp. OttesenSCG-928-B22]|nr:helix-turn-helix domain-containing protein [Parabacteroides sp. OttesenSCG-928-B22]